MSKIVRSARRAAPPGIETRCERLRVGVGTAGNQRLMPIASRSMAQQRGPDRGLFDLWSNFYDAPLVQRLTYQPEHDAVLRELRRIPHQRVLDVGCGTGILTARIKNEFEEASVVGCDFSGGMLRRAARVRRGPAWARGNALQLPFADASWEVVVSTEAFHWFPDQPAALAEFFRVLEPGGRLLVSLINSPLELMSQITRTGSRMMGQPLFWPTRSRMRKQTQAAGFRVESQRKLFRVPGGMILPSVLTVAVRPN
jgi:ubiquinone/menaquinone biosynthesis C-methylase UbiE